MTDKRRRAAVIGHPVAHSKSPVIHGHWLEKYGLDGEYGRVDIAPETLARDFRKIFDRMDNNAAKGEGLCGVNVTVPHKQAVMGLLDFVDDTARAIGAVNTVYKDAQGRLCGTNTDAFGYMENLKAHVPDFEPVHAAVHVLGAGGAARAVIYGLVKAGVRDIRIANRDRSRAEALIADLRLHGLAHAVDWDLRDPDGDVTLVVNTTSLGMKGQPELEIDIKNLDFSAIVSDIVYVPLQTKLLQTAQEQGLRTVTGIGMLVQQARPAFEAFFGMMPEIDGALERKLLDQA